jgi:competence protein ComEC
LSHRRIGRLDLVVLSHPHADHTGGFDLLSRRTAIERVWINGDRRDALPVLSRHAVSTVTSTVVSIGGARFEVLHARPDAPRVNDGSIVLRISYGKRSLLLAGDAESAAETALLDRPLASDVLIVGHHGSNTSSSEAFLAAVRPSSAIIPVGRDNSFHHPHPAVLARLHQAGAQVFRTDRDGAVEVRTDGSSLEVRSLVPRSAFGSRDPAAGR